ncbi:LPXTG-domain-containing protein cell wall anchor domain [Enterococcus moraviensis ATCC BAA-383]|uniref:LPXTG-domain-containing protein cell wall anchor domain n=1 Tax=Enterococcus moraviensis ATCC BAA-383 TaxID=1158609 RepID=R2U222_9ENTE|nr:LPXTG cell wall anchor domain-containing protein [Enterococcus moraviensis]EOI06747.1 LPXTG-domain-containing protein cell wall anchor domain [Enterococcus moraviensis ATCC BAA-383]EOT65084.1 hypothetical protein I586_02818 [Enterococcus moraviensis ATCC BAA-383]OJG66931.1 LPXTG-domain-containing protein cell wall anchor domain [Enterococcus moraviensis]
MKKLFYSICFGLFCFLFVSGPVVSQANGITSNGGISFTPAPKEQTQSSQSEPQKLDPTMETKVETGAKDSNTSKGIFPKTNTENSHLKIYLGIGLLALYLVISVIRKKRLKN